MVDFHSGEKNLPRPVTSYTTYSNFLHAFWRKDVTSEWTSKSECEVLLREVLDDEPDPSVVVVVVAPEPDPFVLVLVVVILAYVLCASLMTSTGRRWLIESHWGIDGIMAEFIWLDFRSSLTALVIISFFFSSRQLGAPMSSSSASLIHRLASSELAAWAIYPIFLLKEQQIKKSEIIKYPLPRVHNRIIPLAERDVPGGFLFFLRMCHIRCI